MGVFKIEKNQLRKQYLAIRNKLNKNEVIKLSKQISKRLNELDTIINANNIMCYVSFGNEVHTHELIKTWLAQGKQVSVPCVVNDDKHTNLMHAVKINRFDDLKVSGKYGILEPTLIDSNIVNPEMFDIIIVPGCTFDIQRNRMGFGAGYYDRYMNRISSNCKKVGVCFDFQVLDKIPVNEHDVPLDMLVTEKRIIV